MLPVAALVSSALLVSVVSAFQTRSPFPDEPLTFGPNSARFQADGTFSIRGQDWPQMDGTWTVDGDVVRLVVVGGRSGCTTPGRYRFRVESRRVALTMVEDECLRRRTLLDGSTWRPVGDVPPTDRRITAVAGDPASEGVALVVTSPVE